MISVASTRDGRNLGAPRPRSGGGVRASPAAGSRRSRSEGQRSGTVHDERSLVAQRPVPRPLCVDRSTAAPRCAKNWTGSSRRDAANHGGRAVDELLRRSGRPRRFVDIFNRTVEPVAGRCRLSTHLCFGNYKGRAVGRRRYAPMFPDFLEFQVDEIHVEMASREFAELELIAADCQTQRCRPSGSSM